MFLAGFFGLPPMGVLVASSAGSKFDGEIGRFGMRSRTQGPMAGVARRGLVGADQGVGGFRVPGQGETGGLESIYGVAVLALRQTGPRNDRATVGVAVAVVAGTKLRLFPFLGVAAGAGHRGVPTFERIAGLRVIKRGPLDQEPARGGMALPAVGAQGSGVGIQMAIRTGAMRQTRKDKARWFSG